jgi:hypothetical protein
LNTIWFQGWIPFLMEFLEFPPSNFLYVLIRISELFIYSFSQSDLFKGNHYVRPVNDWSLFIVRQVSKQLSFSLTCIIKIQNQVLIREGVASIWNYLHLISAEKTHCDLCQHICINYIALSFSHIFHIFLKRVLFHWWLIKLVYYCSLGINVHCKFVTNHSSLAVQQELEVWIRMLYQDGDIIGFTRENKHNNILSITYLSFSVPKIEAKYSAILQELRF